MPPEVLPSGVHGVAIADIEPAKSAPVRTALLERRRPELYKLLALHRAPTDPSATTQAHKVPIAILGAETGKPADAELLSPPPRGGLAVSPRCSVMASITRQKITAASLSFRAVRPNASLQSSRGKAQALWREAIPSAMEMLFFTLSRLRRRPARSLLVTGQLIST